MKGAAMKRGWQRWIGLCIACAGAQVHAAPPVAPGAALWPGVSPSEARAAFDAADLNHDGRITLAEFHKDVLRAWQALDRNRDGVIDAHELQALPQQVRRAMLESLGRSPDALEPPIRFAEVVAARMAAFEAADANDDEQLSLSEVLGYPDRMRRTPREPGRGLSR